MICYKPEQCTCDRLTYKNLMTGKNEVAYYGQCKEGHVDETFEAKSVIVMRYHEVGEMRHTYTAARELAEATGSTVLVVAADIAIESLDEAEMSMYGWVRDRREMPCS